MAYQALVYHTAQGHPEAWTSEDIDVILFQGNNLHSVFLLKEKVSKYKDGRVAVCELPEKYDFSVVHGLETPVESEDGVLAFQTIIVTARASKCVDGPYAFENEDTAVQLCNVTPAFPNFMTDTFNENANESVNLVLTINDYSMAVWRIEGHNRLWFFDSHSRGPYGLHLHSHPLLPLCGGRLDRGVALVRSFRDTDHLIRHLIDLYGENFQYSARTFHITTR